MGEVQTDNINIELLGGNPITGNPHEPIQLVMRFKLHPPPDWDWCQAFQHIAEQEFNLEPEFGWDDEDSKNRRRAWAIRFDNDVPEQFGVYCDPEDMNILCNKLRTAVQLTNSGNAKRSKRKRDEEDYILSLQNQIDALKREFNSK